MTVIIFILGLFVGSFLNLCTGRIPAGVSIVYPGSHCDSCRKKLHFIDMIPVISYVALKGRCRHCGKSISIQYPFMELITGVIFLLIYSKFSLSFYAFKYTVFACFAIVIASIDYRHQEVYLSTTASAVILGTGLIISEAMLYSTNILGYLLGALIPSAVIALIVYTTRAMGEGDIEIAALCGLFLGWQLSLLMLFISFIAGGIVASVLLATKLKKRGEAIAYGPFLLLGALIALLLGSGILNWYGTLTGIMLSTL